jgi:hypothetical protein
MSPPVVEPIAICKWSLLVIRAVMFGNRCHFGELLANFDEARCRRKPTGQRHP